MGQVFAATAVLDFFTGLTREFGFEQTRTGMMGPVLVRKEPVGVVAAGSSRGTSPCSSRCSSWPRRWPSGSTIVIKPAPETPLDANQLATILESSGLPAGVVNIVSADREVGEHLVRHPDIDKVSFTGSTAAGRKIGVDLRRAAQALHPRAGRQVGRHHLRRRRPRHASSAPSSRPG